MQTEDARSPFERGKKAIGSVLGVESPQGRILVTPANWLTLLRLIIAPFFWFTFFSNSIELRVVGTLLFILGALTDILDGKLARRYGHETPFGDFMDPLADKLLVLSAFWAIIIREPMGGLFLTAVIWTSLLSIREIGITLMRIFFLEGGSSLVTSRWGKWKTGVQLTSIIFILTTLNGIDLFGNTEFYIHHFDKSIYYSLVNILFFVSMFFSLTSGILYLKQAKSKKKQPVD